MLGAPQAIPFGEVVIQEAPAGEAEPGLPVAESKTSSFWAKVPNLSPNPRAGLFLIFPTGPGYYSLQDVVTHTYRESPPKNPWPPLSPDMFAFFDADFRYLEDPNNTQHDWSDALKRIHPNDNWMLTIGGEERLRTMDEVDSRLTGKDNTYQLLRTRVFGDLWYQDVFRVYAEFIDAQSFNQDLAPLAIDVNHSDLLNLFFDLKVGELLDAPIYVRGGRQELLYGSQRLISPLDWANTLRTFQGVKAFWHSDKLDVDAFWVQPIVINPTHFDSPDSGRQFAGFWTTYRPQKGQTIDLYYLYLDSTRPATAKPLPGERGGFDVNTFGARSAGDYHHFLWDVEGMYQFGTVTNNTLGAEAATTGIGYQFADQPLNPIVWLYYDYASGDADGGKGGTFNQLFPFGHYYFGYLDLVGRQNINDLNGQFSVNPTKWITCLAQAHFFYLDSGKDALYNAAGTAIRQSVAGTAGLHVGNEVDFTTNFHLSMHQDILVGYSKLFAGEFIRNTGNPGSPELFYVQYSYKW